MGFCFAVSFYFSCNNKVSICNSVNYRYRVVVATAKVQIFKQITTSSDRIRRSELLLLLPQRYKFSSKSQHQCANPDGKCVVVATAKVQIFKQITTKSYPSNTDCRCCCYRKGTNFQANHNKVKAGIYLLKLLLLPQRYKFSSKSQLCRHRTISALCCCCYRKGTNFQANHNTRCAPMRWRNVVVATAKVQIFKQITTMWTVHRTTQCCCYRKGTNFQANHNCTNGLRISSNVVVATAKVQIFKQITTGEKIEPLFFQLLLLPQRYKFSSKSQPGRCRSVNQMSCCCYRKGTNFQANHNCY